MKTFFFLWTENFTKKGHNSSHTSEKSITTMSNRKYMSYDVYIKEPWHMVEFKLNMISDENPRLTKCTC